MNGQNRPAVAKGLTLAAAAFLAVAALPTPAGAGAFEERETRIEHLPEMHDLDIDPVFDSRHRDTDKAENALSAKAMPGDPDAQLVAKHGHWEARRGRSLQEVLEIWADAAGWSLAWESDHAYVLQASARFDGSFVEATETLLESFAKASPPVFGNYYGGNKVLVVRTPKTSPTR